MDELRIGDAERGSAVAALGEHFAQGRLSKEEYDERSEVVWAARTRRDLAPVFVDLPGPEVLPAPPPPGRVPQRAAPGLPHVPRGVLGPVLVALVVLTVLTHLPFVLVGLGLWFLLSRRYAVARPPWAGHRHR